MTAVEINKALDKLDIQSKQVTQKFIDAGRGNERPSEFLNADDPLSRQARVLYDQRMSLSNEIQRRYGPGTPSRLPIRRSWFGPIKAL